jgi:hypothetical protein
MTKRLENAINRLTPAQVEELTALAESLASGNPGRSNSSERKQWKFDWVGGLSHVSERSGVEAQRVAMAEWEAMVERGPSK